MQVQPDSNKIDDAEDAKVPALCVKDDILVPVCKRHHAPTILLCYYHKGDADTNTASFHFVP